MRGIYLIGFSGTGKSTIAQAVGQELNWPVYDLDSMIVDQSKMTIPSIFAQEGEAGFRARETHALQSVAKGGPFVVATGGGAPMREENYQLMTDTGWIITLEGRPETIHARIQRQLQRADADAERPLLHDASPLEHIRTLKHSRQSVYACADWTVHTDRLSSQQVAAEVIRAITILEQLGSRTSAYPD